LPIFLDLADCVDGLPDPRAQEDRSGAPSVPRPAGARTCLLVSLRFDFAELWCADTLHVNVIMEHLFYIRDIVYCDMFL
jgi:hypothetical protein